MKSPCSSRYSRIISALITFFLVHYSFARSQTAQKSEKSNEIFSKWQADCAETDYTGIANSVLQYAQTIAHEGLSKIQRINPDLYEFIEYRYKVTNLKISCKSDNPLFKTVNDGVGFFALSDVESPRSVTIFSPRLFQFVRKQVDNVPPSGWPEEYKNQLIPSSTFHELLHIARIDNLPGKVHNSILSEKTNKKYKYYDDVVYACTDVAFPIPVSEGTIARGKRDMNLDLRKLTIESWHEACNTCALAGPPENFDEPDHFDIRTLFGKFEAPRIVSVAKDRKSIYDAKMKCEALYDNIKSTLFVN